MNNFSERITQAHAASGLTWKQFAALFCVSVRTIHHWASDGQHPHSAAFWLEMIEQTIAEAPSEDPEDVKHYFFSIHPGDSVDHYTLIRVMNSNSTVVVNPGGLGS